MPRPAASRPCRSTRCAACGAPRAPGSSSSRTASATSTATPSPAPSSCSCGTASRSSGSASTRPRRCGCRASWIGRACPVRLSRGGCSRFMYRGAARRIRVLPAASHLVRGRLESAFALADERVPVTGEPRVDVLSQGTAGRAARAARAQHRERSSDRSTPAPRLVLYAPTWRDGARRPRRAVARRVARDRRRARAARRRAAGALASARRGRVRAAGRRPTRVRAARQRSRRRCHARCCPALDALVTDYSSLAFDAALVPLPVVFLAPDLEEYARAPRLLRHVRGRRGRRLGRRLAGRGRAARRACSATTPSASAASTRARALSARVHAFRDGGNTRRVYRAILAGLDDETPAARKDIDDRRPLHDRRRSGTDPLRRRRRARHPSSSSARAPGSPRR